VVEKMNLIGRLRRRQFLWGGLATGASIATGREYVEGQEERARQARIAELASQRDMSQVLKATFDADRSQSIELQKIQESINLVTPTQPYDRAMSKTLIRCSRLGTEQYLKGKTIATYAGEITSLPTYAQSLAGYSQVASLKALEQTITEEIPLQVLAQLEQENQKRNQDSIETNVNTIQTIIKTTTKELVKIEKTVPVYFGFVLSSPEANLMIFRGTQRTNEWLLNLAALQVTAQETNTPQFLGRAHRGFVNIYEDLVIQTREIAQNLDPRKPCYISGHSLGAAIATLAAVDIAITVPALRPQLRLYTYAGPRVGNADFANGHSRLIPNHYRIINLADLVPVIPSTMLLENITYVHCGQEWSFLAQNGDLLPNHVVSTYSEAIDREIETNTPRAYPT
jgi:triacylglycerol lipase